MNSLGLATVIAVVWGVTWASAHRLRAPLLRLGMGPRNASYLLISWRDLASAAAALGIVWSAHLWEGRSDFAGVLAAIGMRWSTPAEQLASLSILLAAACYAINLTFRLVRTLTAVGPRRVSVNMVPATASETLILLLVLSPASGIGEEIVFRGALQWSFTTLTGDPVSAALSQAVLFGMVHLYQGGFGVLRNIAIGVVLGFGTLGSGSLVPAIVAHTLINAAVAMDRSTMPARSSKR
ncbi:MAG: CPBP family intramembrane metalloprotease [Alphaproteobacteria bacterium]|nr:CPBP family intramembrane metalloprotease [Alphaproteobacteria bacterium]